MIPAATPLMTNWRARLAASVSPLSQGVAMLRIDGYRPPGGEPFRPNRTAAVLVGVLDQPEPGILLTRRADHLPQHAGQVSFPGGSAEESDDTAVETALREAEEEIGLSPADVTPLGFLDRFDTVSDYRVLPIVGLVRAPGRWKADRSEVLEVFSLPLEVALDRQRYQKQIWVRGEVRHETHSLEWEEHVVWGATAAMLLNLARRMEQYG